MSLTFYGLTYHRNMGIDPPPLVPIDLNGIVAHGYVALDTLGVDWGLACLGLAISEGMRLRGYDLDIFHLPHRFLQRPENRTGLFCL